MYIAYPQFISTQKLLVAFYALVKDDESREPEGISATEKDGGLFAGINLNGNDFFLHLEIALDWSTLYVFSLNKEALEVLLEARLGSTSQIREVELDAQGQWIAPARATQ